MSLAVIILSRLRKQRANSSFLSGQHRSPEPIGMQTSPVGCGSLVPQHQDLSVTGIYSCRVMNDGYVVEGSTEAMHRPLDAEIDDMYSTPFNQNTEHDVYETIGDVTLPVYVNHCDDQCNPPQFAQCCGEEHNQMTYDIIKDAQVPTSPRPQGNTLITHTSRDELYVLPFTTQSQGINPSQASDVTGAITPRIDTSELPPFAPTTSESIEDAETSKALNATRRLNEGDYYENADAFCVSQQTKSHPLKYSQPDCLTERIEPSIGIPGAPNPPRSSPVKKYATDNVEATSPSDHNDCASYENIEKCLRMAD